MAANQGDAAAQFSLGMAYAEGNGVEADGEQAAQWFRMADDQGHIAAMYNLAASYSGGFDVDQDYAEAARWYRQAALQGHAQDQNNLGVLYDNGFFFSSGRRHTRWTGDWSSDVCSSDLGDRRSGTARRACCGCSRISRPRIATGAGSRPRR